MVKTGQDNLAYYIVETPNWGTGTATAGVPDGDNTPDDGTWSPLLEVQSISGRAKKEEKKKVYRHGRRKRAGIALGKIEPEPLVFELYMVDDDTALNFYDVFLEASFEDAYDEASLTSYTFLIPDDNTPANSDLFEYYFGCVLSELEISISEGEPNIILTATFDVQINLFSSSELFAPVSATYTAHPASSTYLLWSDVGLAKASFQDNGAVTSIQEIDFTVNQNYSKIFTLNTERFATFNVVEGYETSGSLVAINLDSTTIWDEYDDLDGEIVITIARTTSPIVITLEKSVFDVQSVDSAPNEMQTIDADFSGELCDFA